MKIAMIHNEYAAFSGEEAMFYRIAELLQSRGHEVVQFVRSSQDIGHSLVNKASAFFSGIYSADSRRQIRIFLKQHRPDIVHIQNLYPLISPSILPVITKMGIPLVMRCANYRLVCPNGLLLRNGRVCHRCLGGREWQCLLTNCQQNLGKSAGYAIRNYIARKQGWFDKHVNVFYTQTCFQKTILVQNGFDADKIEVIPNMTSLEGSDFNPGKYVGYLGRISAEKGVDTFLDAARQLRHIPFKLAGAIGIESFHTQKLPDNVEYVGFLRKDQKIEFLKNAAIIVVPSICYEGFPGTLLDAMSYSTPVICSAIGGLPEIVQDCKTGRLFEPANTLDLSKKIEHLWNDDILQKKLGQQGCCFAREQFSEDRYYDRLMAAYEKAAKN
jgi:glycosyltransferase involved in cell wall biosynthesis